MREPTIEIRADAPAAIEVIKHVGTWMLEAGLHPSEWWLPENMNSDFLGEYAQPDEFFVVTMDGEPAASAIIQTEQNAQDWSSVDGVDTPPALYVHWVAVARKFAGQGLPRILIDFAEEQARLKDRPVIRLDTNADEPKLRALYESLGFTSVGIIDEGDERTVLYEKPVRSHEAQ